MAPEGDGPGPARPGEAPGRRFLPRQAPIDAVLARGFRFADMSHQGSLISMPGVTQAWDPQRSAFDLLPDDVQPILDVADGIDVLVIGTGADIAVLPKATLEALRAAGLGLETAATRAAVRTYNVLLSENRRVAAALFAL